MRLPVGVRDYLPRAAARRREIASALLGEFDRWGYDRLITPILEYIDVLAQGLGADARAATLRFVEPATGEVVALRPDITPQVARIVATRYAGAAHPVRLAYEGSVLRLAPGARGQRELIQAGVELIGSPAPDGDAEVLALAASALGAARVGAFTIDLGHVALARAALAAVDDPEALRTALARKDRAAAERLAARIDGPARALVAALPDLHGTPDDVLARARTLTADLPALGRALDELARALDLAAADAEARWTLDLGDVRGFDYYTGLRFGAYVQGVGDAILRGGRYDDLVGRYGAAAPATGFAIDVEALAQAEHARGEPDAGPPRAVLVCGSNIPAALPRALRAAGVRVVVDRRSRTTEERAAYAAALNAVCLECQGPYLVGASPEAFAEALAGRGEALALELTARQK